jgi:hypothetical protein
MFVGVIDRYLPKVSGSSDGELSSVIETLIEERSHAV